jgi:hypothetical protein
MLPVTVANPGYPGSYGSPFGPVNSVTLAANGSFVLPVGDWVVSTGAQDSVEFEISSGTTLTALAASSVGRVASDGQNVNIKATSTGGTVTQYIQILGA